MVQDNLNPLHHTPCLDFALAFALAIAFDLAIAFALVLAFAHVLALVLDFA